MVPNAMQCNAATKQNATPKRRRAGKLHGMVSTASTPVSTRSTLSVHSQYPRAGPAGSTTGIVRTQRQRQRDEHSA